MSIISTSSIHRTARLGVGFLMGAVVLVACGESPDQVATIAPVDAKVAPAAPYVSPDQADRAAMLAVRAEKASADALSRRPAPKVAPKAFVSPEQADKAAMLAVRAQKASADAIEGRATASESSVVSAHASADAIEHQALGQSESAHRSADAVERWAPSSTDG
jgi:hypothetical protein